MRRLRIAAVSFAIVTMAVSPRAALSQTAYPVKNIRVIVPSPTGGPSDIVARLIGEKYSVSLGRPVVVDNRPGASQIVGSNMVAKAEPAGTPRAIVLKLNAEIGAALANPDLSKRFGDMGLVAKHSTPEAFGKFLQSEMTRWRSVLAKLP